MIFFIIFYKMTKMEMININFVTTFFPHEDENIFWMLRDLYKGRQLQDYELKDYLNSNQDCVNYIKEYFSSLRNIDWNVDKEFYSDVLNIKELSSKNNYIKIYSYDNKLDDNCFFISKLNNEYFCYYIIESELEIVFKHLNYLSDDYYDGFHDKIKDSNIIEFLDYMENKMG